MTSADTLAMPFTPRDLRSKRSEFLLLFLDHPQVFHKTVALRLHGFAAHTLFREQMQGVPLVGDLGR
ncbi:MAG TPA: hypothetical protein VEI52_17450 [Terriglobales bacterium]|nr:hypothetical protein [Terriglobales bacterium]